MKKLIYLALVIVVVLTSASCSSSRKATRQKDNVIQTQTSIWKSGEAVSSRSSLALGFGSKNVTLGGNLRMKRDEIIQLNLSYTMLITIQVGTLELTRDSVLLVNRINHQYAKASYPEFSSLVGRQISFDTVQKYFWGEAESVESNGISFKYNGFDDLAGRKFPRQMSFRMPLNGKNADATLTLSSSASDISGLSPTDINTGKYTRLTMVQVMNLIMSLIQKY